MFTSVPVFLSRSQRRIIFFSFFGFSRYLASNQLQFEWRINLKNRKCLNSLIPRFGTENWDFSRHMFNFSNVTFTGVKRIIPSRRLNLCIPPSKVSKEQIFAVSVLFFYQLNLHKPTSTNKFPQCKTRLFELSYEYSSLSSDQDFLACRGGH